MTDYVLGFAFDTNGNVALLKKNRPERMAGMWNGIGGKIEPCETPVQAMIREFQEEAGLGSEASLWNKFAVLIDPTHDYTMTCFRCALEPDVLKRVYTVESEEVRIFNASRFLTSLEAKMSNLVWLLPMALTLLKREAPLTISFPISSL